MHRQKTGCDLDGDLGMTLTRMWRVVVIERLLVFSTVTFDRSSK